MKRSIGFWARISASAGVMLLALGGSVILAAGVTLTAEQQAAVDKLKAKGASVLQLAADTDALTVDLGLAGKSATDEDLKLVKTLPKVVELDLHGTAITDEGLSNIESFGGLTRLHLEKTGITDAGLAHLKGLTNLVYLNLYSTGVTDAGLANLSGLKSLKNVYLWQTKVTDAGAAALKKELPGATLNRGEELAFVPPPPPEKPPEMKPADAKPGDPKPADTKPGDPKPGDSKPADTKPGDTKPAAAAKPGDAKPADAKPGDAKPADDTKPAKKKPRPEALDGFIRSWLVLAPIPLATPDAGATEIDKEQVPGEKSLKPKAGDTVKVGDKEYTWKLVRAKDYFLDFKEIAPSQTDDVAAYAVAYVVAKQKIDDVQLLMGSNDQGKLYLNEKEVLEATEGRQLAKDQDKAEHLTLNEGVNVIVFKVINDKNNWQGCVHLANKDGKPVAGVQYKSVP